MSTSLHEVLSTCPNCRVEAALLELVESGGPAPGPIEARCRLCGRWERRAQVLDPGLRFADPLQVEAALRRWAAAEGEEDLDRFIASGFPGLDRAQLTQALLQGRPVTTSFDVVAWLFPSMAAGGGSPPPSTEVPAPPLPPAPPQPPAPPLAPSPPLDAGPPLDAPGPSDLRIALHALITVMLADGIVRAGERAFLAGFAARAGLDLPDPPLPLRPPDLPIPRRPGPILDAMVELALIDRERDGSEHQVIREFARHWGQDPTQTDGALHRAALQGAPPLIRLWVRLRRLLGAGP